MDYSKVVTGFTKLFAGIVFSTVWREEMHVKIVWVTMLALADRNGHVSASVPGLADAARVTIPQCREALQRLMAPDPDSRSKEHEGRRVEEIDGGWRLLNYLKYRELASTDERRIKTRIHVAAHRQRKADVSNGKQSKHIAEAEAEADNREAAPRKAYRKLRKMFTEVATTPLTPKSYEWMTARDKDALSVIGGRDAIKAKEARYVPLQENDYVKAWLAWQPESAAS